MKLHGMEIRSFGNFGSDFVGAWGFVGRLRVRSSFLVLHGWKWQ